MVSPGDLKNGMVFVYQSDPYEVVDANHVMLGRGKGHTEVQARNLRTGNMLKQSFKPSDSFEEPELERIAVQFVFCHRGRCVFADRDDPSNRIELSEEQIGNTRDFLVPELELELVSFEGDYIQVNLPPKIDMRVTEAAPWVKGDTAVGGTKTVTVETGLTVKVPPFVEREAVIRVNTKTGEYVERVKKAS